MPPLPPIKPPLAKIIPHTHQAHGQQWNDPYHWLRDPQWPKVEDKTVLDYLTAENEYTDSVLAPYHSQIDALYKELRGRIKEEDQSVPIKDGAFYYYTRFEEGGSYSINCRKKGSMEAEEEVILDENLLAEGKAYCDVGDISVSDDHTLLAYALDTVGDERYRIFVQEIATQSMLDSAVTNALPDIVWHKKGHGFFYLKMNAQWRADKLYFHRLGTDQKDDVLLYHEKDTTYHLGVDASSCERFFFLGVASSTTTEIYFLDMDQEMLQLNIVEPRKEGHEYSVDHHHEHGFFILTNDKGRNFRLVQTALTTPGQAYWQEIIPHHPEIYLTEIDLYKEHLVVSSKRQGLPHIEVRNLTNNERFIIPFEEASYTASTVFTTYDAAALRFGYASLTTPNTVKELDFTTRTITTCKVQVVLGNFQADAYHTERLQARAEDGTMVPISLVYKKSLKKSDGSNPLLLYGYGSYGHAVAPYFRSNILTLLDRGFVYAIAHIRGGDEMGYHWYEQAKFLTKRLTFSDFIACAEHLIAARYSYQGGITIHGGSAGGMLIGVAVNERPELFKAAIAEVPFVDVLNTMLDESLPLTPGEFKEWGNPKEMEYFNYIRSYSPYDNVAPHAYPAMLVRGGVSDPRVGYWEPAKWVARLRTTKTDENILLLKTNMQAGHAGPTGRFAYLEEVAMNYGFLMMVYGLN